MYLFLKIDRREKGREEQPKTALSCDVMNALQFDKSTSQKAHLHSLSPMLSPNHHPKDTQNWRLRWFRGKKKLVRLGTCKFCCLNSPSLITADGQLIKEQSWLSEQISVCKERDKRIMPSLLFMVINWVEFTFTVPYLSSKNYNLNMKYYIRIKIL